MTFHHASRNKIFAILYNSLRILAALLTVFPRRNVERDREGPANEIVGIYNL